MSDVIVLEPRPFETCAVLLFAKAPSLGALSDALAELEPRTRGGLPVGDRWLSSGSELVVAMRAADGSAVTVDIVDAPWPDHSTTEESDGELFRARQSGLFGPGVLPGCLGRAVQQRWAFRDAEAVVAKHRAFVRVRATYALGRGSAGAAPPKENRVADLCFTSHVAWLAASAGALAYFWPSGEALRSPEHVSEALAALEADNYLPIDLWANTRLFVVDEDEGLFLMDTVGLGNLHLPDLEAVGVQSRHDRGEVDYFLQNCALTMLSRSEPLTPGETLSGPGDEPWVVQGGEAPLALPKRPFRRVIPSAIADVGLRLSLFGAL
jgi:hypothetical protein